MDASSLRGDEPLDGEVLRSSFMLGVTGEERFYTYLSHDAERSQFSNDAG